MADEAVVGQDAAQVRVAFEDDAVQVKGFAFEPAHGRPAFHQRCDHGEFVVRDPGTDTQAPVVLDREQVDHHGKARAVDLGAGFLGQLARAVAPGRLRCAACCRRRTTAARALRA
ncbi:hypothetical protein G6F59_017315 [Rhizopus arrhizus]|nr:hypothetical protein G6F59_017315 [Rhizopus arrhizus]